MSRITNTVLNRETFSVDVTQQRLLKENNQLDKGDHCWAWAVASHQLTGLAWLQQTLTNLAGLSDVYLTW